MAKQGKVTHFEIPVDKMDRAQKFYSDVFGWNIMTMPEMQYTMVMTSKTDEKGMATEVGAINGGMIKRDGPLKHPIVTLQVEDIDASLEMVKKKGGKVVVKKTAMQMGSFAYFEDTEGNVMGLWQAGGM